MKIWDSVYISSILPKIVPTFIKKKFFLIQKSAQHPNSGQNRQCVLLIFYTRCCVDFLLLEGVGSLATLWLGCTAKYLNIRILKIKLNSNLLLFCYDVEQFHRGITSQRKCTQLELTI